MTRHRQKYNSSAVTQISVKPPAVKPSAVESEIIVPLAWTLILSVSLASVATLAAVALRAALDTGWDWWLPLAVGGCVGVLVFAWRVVVVEQDRRELLLLPIWSLETALDRDLDQDGYVGEPEAIETPRPEGRPIYVHDANRERRRQIAGDFRYFLKHAYDGHGTTWQKWDGVTLPSGRTMMQPLWEQWTGRLQKAGLATRAYSTAPLELAGGYRQALETFKNLL